jgi:hypothetical protein
MLAALVVILGGCVGAASSNGAGASGDNASLPPHTVALPPSASIVQPSGGERLFSLPPDGGAGPSGTAAPVDSSGTGLVVTAADDGKTIHLTAGQRFTVDLGGSMDWSVKMTDAQVVRQIVGAPMPAGAQGVYEAAAAGTTILNAVGKPHCSDGAICPMYLLDLSVTFVVG